MDLLPVYNQTGEKVGEQKLSPSVFDVRVNVPVIHQVVVALQSSKRQTLAHAKDRSAVRGGGKKPWRQKGTGRARHGSIRSPLWKGGGVTFGPSNTRNFTKKINKQVKRAAFRMSLSDKVKHEKMLLVDTLAVEDMKTKNMNAFLKTFFEKVVKKADVETSDTKDEKKKTKKKQPSVLLVAEEGTRDVVRSARNIPRVDIRRANSFGLLDILGHEYVLVAKDALSVIEDLYGDSSKSKVKDQKSK